MPDARLGHHHHSSQPPHGYSHHPSGPPPYPSSGSHHPDPRGGGGSYSHHGNAPPRHMSISNGPPLPPNSSGPPPPLVERGGPPGPPIGGPGPGPGPVQDIQMGNGHGGPPPPPGHPGSISARRARDEMDKTFQSLSQANENTWMLIGAVAEGMNDQDRAQVAFENALRHNPNSVLGLTAVANIARSKDNFDRAIDYFQRVLNIKQDNGEVWGSMGHCLLMKDDLPKAYTAYQQALYHLTNPKEPKLWYGIGILYDRYGSFEHAEEAFTSVLKMDEHFEKANEIYFRLGIIYKHQRKYSHSLDCFRYILNNPPRPLTTWDIWFQLGHVYEQDRDYDSARDAYMRVLAHQPDHAKVLQQLGWLYHQPGASFMDQDKAVQYLTSSLETDGNDAQSWYLLGRAFMAGQRYNKAYEAYQQAVYRDGRNPTFWCSIGVLYYQINQYRDALDAYSRAIRLNPYISEVWYNLGSLYESCNNQITDAIDAYSRAAELDPGSIAIKQRLHMLQSAGNSNAPLPPAPGPVDVHPSQYSATPAGAYPNGGSPGQSPRAGAPPMPQDVRMDGSGGHPPAGGRDLPPPPPGGDLGRGHSPGPFRGGGAIPPPLAMVDDSRGSMSRQPALAPMEIERPDGSGPGPASRDAREREREREREMRGDPRDMYRDAKDTRDSRDGPPGRRHIESPGSPRRRNDGLPYPYPPPQGYRGPGEREAQEEWERSRRMGPGPGGPGGPGMMDPRVPSPRMQDRGPGGPGGPAIHPMDRRPSPRNLGEYGPGPGAPGGTPGYGRGNYPPGPPGNDRMYFQGAPGGPPGSDPSQHHGPPQGGRGGDRFDIKREGEQRSYPGGPGSLGPLDRERENGRRPSIPPPPHSQTRNDDPRQASPAPSNTSRSGMSTHKRGRESDAKAAIPSSSSAANKRAKDESYSRGSRKTAGAAAVDEDDKMSGVSGSAGRDSVSPKKDRGMQIPSRTLDEDYDDGAADALMALHGDQPSSAKSKSTSKSPETAPVTEPTGIPSKRSDPPSPKSPSHPKKSRSEGTSTSGSGSGSGSRDSPSHPRPKQMVIEVLNTPRITSPIAAASGASGAGASPLPSSRRASEIDTPSKEAEKISTPTALSTKDVEKKDEEMVGSPKAVEETEPVSAAEDSGKEVDELEEPAITQPAEAADEAMVVDEEVPVDAPAAAEETVVEAEVPKEVAEAQEGEDVNMDEAEVDQIEEKAPTPKASAGESIEQSNKVEEEAKDKEEVKAGKEKVEDSEEEGEVKE